MDRDRMGRKRQPDQERGLRPLHPPLPEEWTSKALRVTMSESDWGRFEALARSLASAAPTQARAYGLAMAALMHSSSLCQQESGPLDWMDWERRKTLRLLLSGRRIGRTGAAEL
jgi:hypothetical protein